MHIVGSTSILKPTPEVARLLNQSGNITTFYRVLTLNSRVFPVTSTAIVKVVPVCKIIEKCIFIAIGNEYFIARFTSQINLD